MSLAGRLLFASALSALCAVVALLQPSHFPLIEPDSPSYIEFSSSRTALYPAFLRALMRTGLTLSDIAFVQMLLFALALFVLFLALLRAGTGRMLVLLAAIAFGANGFFTSLQRTIMTESIFISVTLIACAFWIDYLRTGRAIFLAAAGLCVGLLIGIRPVGVALLPILAVSVWLMWHKRDVAIPVLLAAAILPLAAGPIAEALLYRAEHGSHRGSVLGPTMLGKAAMLLRPDTVFTGPHAEALDALGKTVTATYAPVDDFLDGLPSLAAYPVLTAFYEVAGQYTAIDLTDVSKRSGVPGNELAIEIGKQAIAGNLSGYLKLSLVHYAGQWSVMALKFPPAADAVKRYIATYPGVPLDHMLRPFLPPPARIAIIVYPAFVIAGVVTLALSVVLLGFVLRPARGDGGRGHHLMLAALFAASTHGSMLLVSFLNVSTPRYLMAVYPQLVLAGVFLLAALSWRRPLTPPPA